MATLKLKPKNTATPASGPRGPARAPVRGAGSGVRARPTLAEAQAERIAREERYQAQLKERQQGPGAGAGGPRDRDRGADAPRGRGRDAARGPDRGDAARGPGRDNLARRPGRGDSARGTDPGERPRGPGVNDRPRSASGEPRPRSQGGDDRPRGPGGNDRPHGQGRDDQPRGPGRDQRARGPGRDDRPRGPARDAGPRDSGAPFPSRAFDRPDPYPQARGADRNSRRPTPTWDEPARGGPRPGDRPQVRQERPGPPPRPGRPPAPGDRQAVDPRPAGGAFDARGNQAFSARAGGKPARAPLEPARRHDPSRARPRPDADDHDDRPEPTSAPGSLRLSKYMGELGIASRREADEWIEKGWVRVDGRVVNELGSRVMPGQHVTVDEKARHVQAQKVTVLINKPVGYVSGQAEDGYEPALVLVKPANQWSEDHSGTRWLPQHLRSLVPAGRLDIDSVGLLVLTQDGRVAKQLIGERSDIEKEYLVRVAAAEGSAGLTDDGLALLRHGLELDGEPLREAHVEWVNEDQLRFVLREGKKRQIRRMCEAVGLQVIGLKRVRIGRVMLGDLPAGQWRYLRADEGFA